MIAERRMRPSGSRGSPRTTRRPRLGSETPPDAAPTSRLGDDRRPVLGVPAHNWSRVASAGRLPDGGDGTNLNSRHLGNRYRCSCGRSAEGVDCGILDRTLGGDILFLPTTVVAGVVSVDTQSGAIAMMLLDMIFLAAALLGVSAMTCALFASRRGLSGSRSCESLSGHTRKQARVFMAVSTIAMMALPVGCSGSAPAPSLPPTTAASAAPSAAPDLPANPLPLPPGTITYMSELREVPSFNGNEFDQGVVGVIGGRDLLQSLRTRFCKNQSQVTMYNLRQPYSNFTATVGLDDRSDPSASVQFEIIVGENVVFQQQAAIGQAIAANVSVRDSNMLTLSATLLSARSPCNSVAVWGEARVES